MVTQLATLVAAGTITQAEAEAAEIIWAGVATVDRLHALIPIAQAAYSLTDEQVDALFGIT